MKKLIFVFVALFTVVLISGCGARQNTVRFDDKNGSEEEPTIIEDTEVESDEVTEEATEDMVENSTQPKGKLAVTSFDGAFLKTNLSYNVVHGTVSSSTQTIEINDYKLLKYVPGQTEWSYIATTRFGTLKDGLNNYVVKTFDANGDQTDSLIFSIDYDAPAIPNLPDVGSSHWLILLISLMLAGFYTIFRRFRWL